MQRNKIAFPLMFVLAALLLFPSASFAFGGVHADDIKIKFFAKQGGKWIKAATKRADDKGVLEFENVLPGWYELELKDDDDAEAGQTFAVRARMVDEGGRKLKEKTDVDLYYKNSSGDKTFIATVETDKKGWLEVSGVYPGLKYYFNISERDNAHLKNKDGRARIKVKAKIDGSDWFRARYARTDESNTLEVENVLEGKYKFSYNKKDRTADQPFTLKVRMVDEDGSKIKKETKVKLYVYQNKLKVMLGEFKTDKKGWLTFPGTMTKMKYKLSL